MAVRFELRGVGKHFGGVVALDEMPLVLRAGEIHGLIGPNGAGKSTVVNISTGIYRPDSGKVFLNGEDITRLSSGARARRGIGRTFQMPRLYESMTVGESIKLALQLRQGFSGERMSRKGTRLAAETLLEADGLASDANVLTRNLAYGQQKRLEVSIATLIGHQVLLLDEPTAGLTADEADLLLAPLVHDRGNRAVLLIEHNMELMVRVCDEITVMDSGRWLAAGEPKAVQNDPAVVVAYLGTPGGDDR